jgi:hypothetical protein
MASVPPNPNLGKSQALNIAQTTVQRLATIVPSLTTALSPVTVYQPGPGTGVGNELTAYPGAPVTVSASYGIWIAPDLNGDGSAYYVQVECFGAGGGAGGGSAAAGGGGGGGGEYACETQYLVKPGVSYGYVVGLPGTGGANNSTEVNPGSAGTDGGNTIFDIAGLARAGGVLANGGEGGDQTAVGIGGPGGTGSDNSIHFDGGNGGTNSSHNGSDNPLTLAVVSGMFAGNTLNKNIIPAWYIFNETGPTGGKFNDSSLHGNSGTVTNYTGGYGLDSTVTPTQVPAFAEAANPPLLPVAQAKAICGEIKIGALTSPAAKITAPTFSYSGTRLTMSMWVQCDPSGVWGNSAAGSIAVLSANTQNYTGNTMSGYALFLENQGTAPSPNWVLNAAVGNGSRQTLVTSSALTPTPSTWYYVVMTYNSGTLTLYVNGTSAGTATSSGYTSVPSGAFAPTLAMDPGSSTNWFFGSITNAWWATDAATSSLVAQAYGLTPPTGGAGGGASGGPSANGGAGISASGGTGGAAGTPATQPASLASTTTPAMSGYPGANAGVAGRAPRRLGVSTTTVTQTVAGTYTQELPQGVTQITAAACWGAGSGGSGGTTSVGGQGGAGGEYAAEATYTPSTNPFTYVVGSGGNNSSTGNGNGGDGNDSFIDGTGVYANGGSSSGGGTGSTNTTHHNGGNGGAVSAFGGGASGGNSGAPAAAGNAGLSSASNTHASAPAAQTGGGQGGAGGDSASVNTNDASTGASPGAGGGGAGNGLAGSGGTTTLTKTYEAVYTASYYGPDATGGNGNRLRSTSTMYQGGETASGGSYNGNQRSVMTFNIDQIGSDFAGYTPTGLSLKLTNQHSWYNSGMTVEIDVGSTKYPPSAPGTWLGNQNYLATGTIGEGSTHTYDLGATVAGYFINGQTNFLGLGAFVAADHPYNLNYYGYFTGGHGTALEITITGQITTSGTAVNKNSGYGSDGQVQFTYETSAPYVPPAGTTGGPYGGGGGGSGNMASSPALTVLTVPFSSAATYCGTDATSNATAAYSLNLQNNPASGVNSVLFAGGQAVDAASGTKNSVLLLPANLQSLLGNGAYTVEQVFLTFTNANPSSDQQSVLEVGYSGDTTLPQLYYGTTLAGYIGAIPVPSGATTITYDLSQSDIGALIQNGTATALILGPGANPTFDAYNTPSGPDFYCALYGPGAYDAFGNAQYPYLTIVLQKTLTVQQAGSGSGGAILITAIDNEDTFVSSVQPYTTTDDSGNLMAAGFTGPVSAINQSTGAVVGTIQPVDGTAADGSTVAAGYTGPVTVFDPGTPVGTIQPVAGTDSLGNHFAAGYTGPVSVYHPGSSPLTVESWTNLSLLNGWTANSVARYKLVGYNMLLVQIDLLDSSATSGTMFSVPTIYGSAITGHFISGVSFYNATLTPTPVLLQVGAGSGANVTVVLWAKQSKRFLGSFYVTLD